MTKHCISPVRMAKHSQLMHVIHVANFASTDGETTCACRLADFASTVYETTSNSKTGSVIFSCSPDKMVIFFTYDIRSSIVHVFLPCIWSYFWIWSCFADRTGEICQTTCTCCFAIRTGEICHVDDMHKLTVFRHLYWRNTMCFAIPLGEIQCVSLFLGEICVSSCYSAKCLHQTDPQRKIFQNEPLLKISF